MHCKLCSHTSHIYPLKQLTTQIRRFDNYVVQSHDKLSLEKQTLRIHTKIEGQYVDNRYQHKIPDH